MMDDFLRELASLAAYRGDSLQPMLPGYRSPQPALTCDICGYEDDTRLQTAVSEDDDGVIRCLLCREKATGIRAPMTRRKRRARRQDQ